MQGAEYRQERDRFIAFAFAAADLLLELDQEQKIVAVQGASLAVTGRSTAELLGSSLSGLFGAENHVLVRHLLGNLPVSGGRFSPVVLEIAHASGRTPQAIFGGCRMPTMEDRFFATLTLAALETERRPAPTRDAATGLLDKDSLLAAAESAALDPNSQSPKTLTLMRVAGFDKLARQLPKDQSERLLKEFAGVFRAGSLGGDSAARVEPDAFARIDSGTTDPAALAAQLRNAARSAGLAANVVDPIVAIMDLSVDGLDPADVRRALAHAVKQTIGSGKMVPGATNVREQFTAACNSVLEAVATLRSRIERREIVMAYQPVVSLKTLQPHHYEALARRLDGGTAVESITFGEEIGLIAEIDLMIFKMVLEQLGSGPGPAIAVNFSGQSVQQERFRSEIMTQLGAATFKRERLLFELTESATVENIAEVAAFLRSLRALGHGVCLDDFGAGAAAYSYLRNFEVDFVKIDGPFLQAAVDSQRDYAMVASVVKLCSDLKCETIGEMIETEAQSKTASSLGIDYGQGWLFGKAVTQIPEAKSSPLRAGKRLGVRETWG